MANQKRKYMVEFKQAALRFVEVSVKSVRQVETDLGITPGLLRKWKVRYQLNSTTGESGARTANKVVRLFSVDGR